MNCRECAPKWNFCYFLFQTCMIFFLLSNKKTDVRQDAHPAFLHSMKVNGDQNSCREQIIFFCFATFPISNKAFPKINFRYWINLCGQENYLHQKPEIYLNRSAFHIRLMLWLLINIFWNIDEIYIKSNMVFIELHLDEWKPAGCNPPNHNLKTSPV